MPPKKQQTKKDKEKKQKSTEDKTFGMKNKNKSAKVQRYIQQVNTQAKHNAEQGKGPVSFYDIAPLNSLPLTLMDSPRPNNLLKRRPLNKRREKNLPHSSNLFKLLKRYLSVLIPRLFFVNILRAVTVREGPSVSSLTI
jgi:hypothetical protein